MASREEKIQLLKDNIGAIQDFPIKGILFRDIFTIFLEPKILQACIDIMIDTVKECSKDIGGIVGLDARGFLFGPSIALALKVPFIPVRKAGKLPGETIKESYDLEYGSNTVEIQKNSIKPGQRLLIVDDLLATGGTLKAACNLIEKVGGITDSCLVLIELTALKGRENVPSKVVSLIKYDD
ncbi:DgyrCDS1312 [Dimorphilus gyrociliatus]|uniref:Adenine phosphoribosyltransferase n=1 Tax=Dimorphilus gyrociliatus TaxID=2664684 RepID=A0A7I8V6W4_9ANNE|nr:DgyrCDS1312 [Dimorphilus gyrociliatus]